MYILQRNTKGEFERSRKLYLNKKILVGKNTNKKEAYYEKNLWTEREWRIIMKKKIKLFCCISIFLLLLGCSKKEELTEMPGTVEENQNEETKTEPDSTEEELGKEDEVKVYRGVMEDLAVDEEGNTVWILQQAEGTDFGIGRIQVVIDENTKIYPETQGVGNGSYLEVLYKGEIPLAGEDMIPSVRAMEVKNLLQADMVVYNGEIIEIEKDREVTGNGSILLEPLNEGGSQWLFHYGPETEFFTSSGNEEDLKVGLKINIFFDGSSTRSIPPQSTALEIREYVNNH